MSGSRRAVRERPLSAVLPALYPFYVFCALFGGTYVLDRLGVGARWTSFIGTGLIFGPIALLIALKGSGPTRKPSRTVKQLAVSALAMLGLSALFYIWGSWVWFVGWFWGAIIWAAIAWAAMHVCPESSRRD